MNLEGKIKVIMDENVFSEKFKKREFVIVTRDEYPQDILVEVVNDKCAILDQFNIGDDVNLSINIRGREWINPEGVAKYFNSIQAWRIERIGHSSGSGNDFQLNGEIAQAHHD